ncbi:ATP-grasp ribosomal peptide maturase [Streptomyces flavofungini]|uniref:ATP-grasp ribosomal peptide maturase n=1 Tax=Streptomyces flavofungini TaxID=68200 RepID=A0ABS0XIT4_9ACTN|nr:ATP-grasp ribosomal peptide maturase [Streptomyces flavofungini]MBJ3813129.1 ATP-grasp ribosomal peptide maturase [Streptomyces flavofungini]GHC89437.1 ATP-grasp ribosomal peptide maturase [Streptomyces flavofungini]
MTSSVLILTDETDITAGRVAAELAVRGVPLVRVDPADFPTRLSMSAQIATGATWSGALTDLAEGRTAIDLAAVGAVYYRRPTQFRLPDGMNRAEQAFAYGEARRGFGGVLGALDSARWVNDRVAAARAEYKPLQLATASRLGLTIPHTLITSEPDRAYQWAKQQDGPIIYKPLSGIWHADDDKVRVIYTNAVDDLGSLLAPSLGYTAHLFQQQVPKDHEARAIVVGQRVFAVAIDAATARGLGDWRSDYDHLSYRVITLPEDVADKLVALHRDLGLVFGAVDLIRRPDGQWVFLETNQSGEWDWLISETGIPVAEALADVLTAKAPA